MARLRWCIVALAFQGLPQFVLQKSWLLWDIPFRRPSKLHLFTKLSTMC
jgi:hypothetical protein